MTVEENLDSQEVGNLEMEPISSTELNGLLDDGMAEENHSTEEQEKIQGECPPTTEILENNSPAAGRCTEHKKNHSVTAEDSQPKRRRTVIKFKKIAPAPPQGMLVIIPSKTPNDKPPPITETVPLDRKCIQELYGRLLAERLYALESLDLQRNARLGIEEIISKYEQLDNTS